MIDYANNVATTLYTAVQVSDTTIAVNTIDNFPILVTDHHFLVTISNINAFEIIKVTAITDNTTYLTLTVVRAQENTTATAFDVGDKVEMLITAGHFNDLRDNSLRYDGITTAQLLPNLNADMLDGYHAESFYDKNKSITIKENNYIDFGGQVNKESIKLNAQFADLDTNYNDVVFLLTGQDKDGLGTTFYDLSVKNNKILSNGATYSYTEQKWDTKCIYIQGSNFLYLENNTNFDLGTDSFTFETWIKIPTDATFTDNVCPIITAGTQNTDSTHGGWAINLLNSDYSKLRFVKFLTNGTTVYNDWTFTALTTNTWHHIVLIRLKDIGARLFINGTLIGTTITTFNGITLPVPNTQRIYIGAGTTDAMTNGYPGNCYLQDFRLTKNNARYWLTVNVPTSSLPTTGLTNEIYDPYFLNTTLLCHFNGIHTTTTFSDSSLMNNVLAAAGHAQISTTQSKFGGSSAYFDGSGDYISINNNAGFDFSNGYFTIECWFYATANVTTTQHLLGKWYSTGTCSWSLAVSTTNAIGFAYSANGNWDVDKYFGTGNSAFTINAWHHAAVVRDSVGFKLYLDGVLVANKSDTTTTIINTTNAMTIGGNLANQFFLGYIDEVRITKVLRYDYAPFSPPTMAFSDLKNLQCDPYLSNVGALLHFNAIKDATNFIDSGPLSHTITTVGDTKHNIYNKKFGTSSAYFDGTGDLLTINYNSIFELGADNFTIECWCYPTAFDSNDGGFITFKDSSIWTIKGTSTGVVTFSFSNAADSSTYSFSTDTGYLTLNNWHHVAVTRNGSLFTIWVDGVAATTSTTAITVKSATSGTLKLGGTTADQSTFRYQTMYMDEFRFTKYVARYVSRFIPATSQFPDRNLIISIGNQDNTLYQRSSKHFAWYTGGIHSDIDLDPGAGGTTTMVLNDAGHLLVGKTNDNNTGALCQLNGFLTQKLTTGVTPANVGEFLITAVSNTSISLKYKGTDGVVRSASITLS